MRILYGADGRPFTVEKPRRPERNGMQVDVYSLPAGCRVRLEDSKRMHQMLRDNARLRELVEAADRMTGTRTLHLAMMRRVEMPADVEKALIENAKFAEKVMEKMRKEAEESERRTKK